MKNNSAAKAASIKPYDITVAEQAITLNQSAYSRVIDFAFRRLSEKQKKYSIATFAALRCNIF
jgi:hypothetical protein